MSSPESSLVCQGDGLYANLNWCWQKIVRQYRIDCAGKVRMTPKQEHSGMHVLILTRDFTLHVICIAIQIETRSILSLESSCKFALWTSALAQGNNQQGHALSATIAVQSLQMKPNTP